MQIHSTTFQRVRKHNFDARFAEYSNNETTRAVLAEETQVFVKRHVNISIND